ncbi:ATP-binding protein [Candidatus Nitrosocosmicus franklandus]|uniref:histidine kinase n=1 Tax=Candidatus Nitrosocosmicus franklandianus TaxID=1798806 RepID=A0A484I6W5_9ARCH|nr:ATP-binding protein [Candidatus Nitrosocosmicus franklandus]VFJ13469.1 putative Alkaline phosphatase synthesis sensor protein PhoR [Candidatus Nitrosocosmicus franklandus]
MSETTESVDNDKDASSRLLNLINNVNSILDISISSDKLSFFINSSCFVDACKALLERNVQIRFILQSPPKNTEDFKHISSAASKIKYLEGVQGISAISDSEYFSLNSNPADSRYNDVFSTTNKTILSIVKKSFDALFSNAISYLETSTQTSDEFNILPPSMRFKVDVEISDQIVHFLTDSKFIYIYSTIGAMLLGYQNYLEYFEKIQTQLKAKQHAGVRWITSIQSRNELRLVKNLLQMGIDIRHTPDRPPFDFALSDKYFACAIERNEENKLILDNMLLNDDRANLTFYNMIFEKLWNSAIGAQDRIKEMERGNDDNIAVVSDSTESLHKLFELFTLAKKEILIILPSTNGFFRTEMSGGFKMLNRMGTKGIRVRVLTLPDQENSSEIKKIQSKYPDIYFRDLEPVITSFNRIMVIDRENTVILEVTDDGQLKFTEALGKAIFIDGSKTSETIASIFDSLWTQSEIHNRLKEAHEKLKVHGKMQSRFMDLVAHELRTPLQSILGITEILKEDIQNNDQNFMLQIIMSNARRLRRLSENILDITRLEGNILYLNKEEFSLNELVKSTISDYITNIEYNKSISFEYKNFDKEFVVTADKFRITQVIQNLVDNSIRFTKSKGGKIVLTLSEKIIHSKEIVVISVTDNGEGLKPELLSRLFTKFSSDSYYGAGIGLYLCRKLIEAHGGRIWAMNNKNKNGCTFSFGIPKKG